MNRFQKLLLAPAALGLMAPVAASAADLNIAGVSQYGSEEQVTSITQFSDVQPTDWAYQALSNLIERYGCVAGYPNGTYKGKQAMTRYEAAALLNACLDRITEVTDELKRLMKEFEKELAVLKGRVDGLEAKVAELEATQFSTTTKLSGIATFVLGANSFGGTGTSNLQAQARATEGGTSFNYDVRLNLDTSFTGKDLLRTQLRAGNFADSGFGGGGTVGTNDAALLLNQLEVAFQQDCGTDTDCGDVVAIQRLFYQVPVGNALTLTVGGKVRQDDMLAMWPSVYPSDTLIDFFTYAGAPGAYNSNLGPGLGLWWKQSGWSVSANYVAGNGDNGTPSAGGIGTSGSEQTGTLQLGYSNDTVGIAAAYTYSKGVGVASGTPFAVLSTSGNGDRLLGLDTSSTMNSLSLSAYWQPSNSGWIPSISTGWGLNTTSETNPTFNFNQLQSQSWYVGLQWSDVLLPGNKAGMAVGQPTFVTRCGDACEGTPQDAQYAWEWWYGLQVTDNITVTPSIFYLSNLLGQVAKQETGNGVASLSDFGGLVKTTFKF
ncbi:carbohydrate porin [Synechococcus sp. HJ21-Hayes]|uniref:iron uptake porin n=2 Tax=unclassified Synechococcus TaxID=2626047 RepID=UPI0020CCAD74|nr:iron uptake porin [Synechococcus sp. HJ21-Hayes]MCP9854093.1 carbohydrate porin [Synechococcus sp. HJ21-Hayes]